MIAEKQKSLKMNFIMNATLTMSSFIFPLITFPYVSRILGPAGTGKVSFATSVISYFALFAQMGIPTYGIRYCAKIRDDKMKLSQAAQEIFTLNLLLTIATYVIFFVMLFTVPQLQKEKTLQIIVSMTMLFNAIGMEWLYKALEQYTYITIRSVVFKLIAVAAMFALVRKEQDYVVYGAISIFAASASNIFNLVHSHRYISFHPVGKLNIRKHLKPVLVFFGMACATTIYVHLDIVMLGLMKTDVDVGYYHAAVKIKSILVSIVTSLGVVLLPRSSYYLEKQLNEEFYEITQKALRFVLLLATPLMIYFILFAKEGIFFLSGNAYEGSIIPMQIIMPTLLFIGMSNITGLQILVPLGKEIVVLYSEITGAVVDLILNLILIPRYASSGAAIGMLAAEIAVWLVQILYLKDDIKKIYKDIHWKTILLGIMVSCLCAIWVKAVNVGNFLTLLISAVLFFMAYGIVLFVTKEPLFREALEMIQKRIHRS